MASSPTEVDVVIVGAGISGLTVAYELLKHQPELNIAVLEARDRIGGRVHSVNIGTDSGERIDIGGQWIGNTQTQILRLIDELGIEKCQQYMTGKHVTMYKDKTVEFEKDNWPGGAASRLDLLNMLSTVEADAKYVPPSKPFYNNSAAKWSKQSLDEWATKAGWTKEGKSGVFSCISEAMDVEPQHVSYLFCLMYLNSTGGNLKNVNGHEEDGAMRWKIRNGAQTLCDRLHKESSAKSLHLSTEVKSITDHAKNACDEHAVLTVETKCGQSFIARQVVLAVPPVLINEIKFTPKFNEHKANMIQNLRPKGDGIKFVITYPTAFWRDSGHSGMTTDDNIDYSITTFDACTSTTFALCGFISWRPQDVTPPTLEIRQRTYLKHLVKMFGEAAEKYICITDCYWLLENYSRGAVAVMAPSVWGDMSVDHDYHGLRGAHGLRRAVHFAGTEMAHNWMGYMNGAVDAAERVSKDVLTNLRGTVVMKMNQML